MIKNIVVNLSVAQSDAATAYAVSVAAAFEAHLAGSRTSRRSPNSATRASP